MQPLQLQYNIQKYLVLALLFFIAMPVFAAKISFDVQTGNIGIGQQFQTDVLFNSQNEEINAIEGTITFSHDVFELKEIKIANSIINFWVEQPILVSEGRIAFSGITPGGYRGEKGLLFSLIYLSKKEGNGLVSFTEAKALQNDGKGTKAPLKTSNFQFIISKQFPLSPFPIGQTKDTKPPESFAPEIASNPTIFEGKQILVFVTQDKESGIDHYEVKEVRQGIFATFSKWMRVESPYILHDQELRSYILVKAVDKAGNERVISISPKNPLAWYKSYQNWFIIVTGLVIAWVIRKFL